MASLTLQLNIISARNLANVNLITKMNVYGVITIHGDDTQKKQKMKTAVDRSGGSHPTWNHAVKFSVNERLARDGRLTLAMRLVCRRVLGNKDIGGVNVPLLELLNSITPSINGDGNGQEMMFVTYQVKSPSGKRKGSLTFSYRFNTPPTKPDIPSTPVGTAGFPATSSASPRSEIEHSPSAPPESSAECRQPPFQIDSDHQKQPVAAGSSLDPLPISYGAGSSAYDKSGYAYHHAPPPQSSYAYFVPPEARHQGYGAYGYAPASSAGYGYGGPTTPQPKGIGLGLGVGAGLLGGLMAGDIVSDVANCFDL